MDNEVRDMSEAPLLTGRYVKNYEISCTTGMVTVRPIEQGVVQASVLTTGEIDVHIEGELKWWDKKQITIANQWSMMSDIHTTMDRESRVIYCLDTTATLQATPKFTWADKSSIARVVGVGDVLTQNVALRNQDIAIEGRVYCDVDGVEHPISVTTVDAEGKQIAAGTYARSNEDPDTENEIFFGDGILFKTEDYLPVQIGSMSHVTFPKGRFLQLGGGDIGYYTMYPTRTAPYTGYIGTTLLVSPYTTTLDCSALHGEGATVKFEVSSSEGIR